MSEYAQIEFRQSALQIIATPSRRSDQHITMTASAMCLSKRHRWLKDNAYLHVGGKYQMVLDQTGLPYEEETSIYSLFGVYHAAFGNGNLTLGLRQDEHDLFDDQFSWRIGRL